MNPSAAPHSKPAAGNPLSGASLTTDHQSGTDQVTQDLAIFVKTYRIRAIESEPSQVALTIPEDKTIADFLIEGQSLSIALHLAFPKKYETTQAIWPERLEKFLADPAFRAKGTGLETITDGCVSGTNGQGMTREGASQKLAEQGLRPEDDLVLVVAHTARYLADATSIFEGQVARAASGTFGFFSVFGLNVYDFGDSDSDSIVFSSARILPSE